MLQQVNALYGRKIILRLSVFWLNRFFTGRRVLTDVVQPDIVPQRKIMRNHLTRQQLEGLTLCWEQWEAEAVTRTQKNMRARLHLIFLLMRYGGLRLGEVLALEPRSSIDTITGMLRVAGSNAREILLPVSAMRNIRRILGLPQAAEPGFLQFDQSFLRKKFYAVGSSIGLSSASVGPRAIRYSRGLELLDLHVPMPLVLKFLGQQDADQLLAFLNFSEGEARKLITTQTQGRDTDGATCHAGEGDDGTNLFWGIVTRIYSGMRKVHVEITTFSDFNLTVACSPEEAALHEVHESQVLSARVDPERVVLSAEKSSISLPNCVKGTVESLHSDMVETFVCVGLADGTTLRATVETCTLGTTHLREGKKVFAHFASSAVRIVAD